MKIKRIKLCDFRQFFGNKNTFEFSVDTKRNITLIHAENGVGKTTILNSILWCFYNKFTEDFESKTKIVNIDALEQGINKCEVEVEFIHEDKNYSAKRIYNETTKESSLTLFAIIDGDYQPIYNDKNLLNSVIPEEMAEYFLFHGEGISKLQSENSNFREAIRDILGFNLALKAIEDLNLIKGKWQLQLQKINQNEKKFNKLSEEINYNQVQLNDKHAKRQDINYQINEYKLIKKNLDDEIINCKIADATVLKRNIQSVEKDISLRKTDIIREETKRQKLINNYGWRIFGINLSEKSIDFIETSTLAGKIPAPYDETLVNDILNKRICICGREVINGSQEFENINNLIDKANTAELTNRLVKARSFSQNIGNNAKEFIDTYNDITFALKRLHHESAELGTRLKNLIVQLDSIDDLKLKELRSKENDASSKLSNLELSNNSLAREIDILTSKVSQLKNEIIKHTPMNDPSLKLSSSILFIEKTISACQSKLKQTEINSKDLIKKYVNDIIEEFSRKDFTVSVDDNFKFELIRKGGGIVAKSKGEKLILNLAFVSALIKLAAQRSKAEGKFLQPGTVAPFIIDAPFGELDETYREATAKFLPENSEQLVLLLSSSHWRGTVSGALKDKIGREYLLISHKKSSRGKKPIDEIFINGKKYIQSIYEDDFDGTSICEVK